MMATEKKKELFCVADPQFENNKKFQFVWVEFDKNFTAEIIGKAVNFWKKNIFPVLLKSIRR